MRPLPTPHQQAVSKFLATSAAASDPDLQLPFFKAALLSLRAHGVPALLAARTVNITPWKRSLPRKLYALVVEKSPYRQ